METSRRGQSGFVPFPWRQLAAALLFIGSCNGACAAAERRDHAITFAYLMIGPFAGWAIFPDEEIGRCLPFLVFATLTAAVPLAIYLWNRDAPLAALVTAALSWVWWGYYLVVGMWI